MAPVPSFILYINKLPSGRIWKPAAKEFPLTEIFLCRILFYQDVRIGPILSEKMNDMKDGDGDVVAYDEKNIIIIAKEIPNQGNIP